MSGRRLRTLVVASMALATLLRTGPAISLPCKGHQAVIKVLFPSLKVTLPGLVFDDDLEYLLDAACRLDHEEPGHKHVVKLDDVWAPRRLPEAFMRLLEELQTARNETDWDPADRLAQLHKLADLLHLAGDALVPQHWHQPTFSTLHKSVHRWIEYSGRWTLELVTRILAVPSAMPGLTVFDGVFDALAVRSPNDILTVEEAWRRFSEEPRVPGRPLPTEVVEVLRERWLQLRNAPILAGLSSDPDPEALAMVRLRAAIHAYFTGEIAAADLEGLVAVARDAGFVQPFRSGQVSPELAKSLVAATHVLAATVAHYGETVHPEELRELVNLMRVHGPAMFFEHGRVRLEPIARVIEIMRTSRVPGLWPGDLIRRPNGRGPVTRGSRPWRFPRAR